MKPYIIITITRLSFILIFLFYGCKPDGDNKINKGIELYNNGESSKAISYIEEGLINSALIKELKENHLLYGDNILFYRQKNNIKTVWPIDLNIELNNNYTIISYNPDSKKIGLSNGSDIKIYNYKGALIKTCGPTPDEKRIKAFTIIKENIYYYKDKNIYIYDLAADTEKLIADNKSITAPDKEPFDVKFYKTENELAVSAGIAGKYNISIFDIKNNSVILQNINAASSKILLKNGEMYYIGGSAGKYSLLIREIKSKKQKEIIAFDNLLDIELLPHGILFENKKGFWKADYQTGNKDTLPFNYKLSGQCSGSPVIRYLNKYCIIDMPVFIEKISRIKEKMPDVFEDKKENR